MARDLRRVSQILNRRTPGRLSRVTSLQAINDLYSTQGGDKFYSQSANPATSTQISMEAHTSQISQFLSSSASAPSAPTSHESFNATHVTSYSNNSRGTVSGTSLYLSKDEHRGSPTWGILISECFPWRTSATSRPVFVQSPPGSRHPNTLHTVNLWTAWRSFPDSTVS